MNFPKIYSLQIAVSTAYIAQFLQHRFVEQWILAAIVVVISIFNLTAEIFNHEK